MSTPFNPVWLEMGAIVPVDCATTYALLDEVKRLRDGQCLHQKEWRDLTKEQCWDLLTTHRNDPFALLVEVQKALEKKNHG
jgi:hypothetical protein